MEQFYFLSIVANTLGGLVLIADHFSEKVSFFQVLNNFLKNVGVRLILAIVIGFIGFIKLVWPFNGIPILGDFFPMLAGLGVGFTLVFDFLRSKSDVAEKTQTILDKIFINNKFVLGLGAILVAVLHFFLCNIVFF